MTEPPPRANFSGTANQVHDVHTHTCIVMSELYEYNLRPSISCDWH